MLFNPFPVSTYESTTSHSKPGVQFSHIERSMQSISQRRMIGQRIESDRDLGLASVVLLS